jgi:MFS family permease
MSSYNPLVSAIKSSFNVDITLVALASTFHMLPLAFLCLFAGTLSDLYYRPKILMYGLFISAIGSLVNAISPNISVFLLSRSIQGTGSALIMPVAMALIGDITPKEELGRAMGFNGMFMAFFSAGLTPLISGFLGEIHWRLVPLYILAWGLTVGILSRVILRGLEAKQQKGSVRLVFQKIRHTIGNRNIALLAPVGFLAMFVWAGMMPLISDTLSLPPLMLKKSEIGTIFSTIGFMGIFFSYIGGILTDRFSAKTNMVFGMLMMTVPMFLLTFANSYWSYLILLMVNGALFRVSQIARGTLGIELMPEARGSASAITQFAQYLGFSAAPLIMPQIYVSSGLNSVYLSNIALLLVSIVFIAFIRIDRS